MYGSPLADATTLLARSDVAELLGTSRQLSAGGDADLADLVAPFVDASASDDSGDLSPRHLWPLVARVHLRGPFAVTAGGVLLRDVPGLADESASRSGVLERVLEAADSLLLVSSINRAANDKGAKSLLPLPLRRELLDSGYLGDLAFIASKARLRTPSDMMSMSPRHDVQDMSETCPHRRICSRRRRCPRIWV